MLTIILFALLLLLPIAALAIALKTSLVINWINSRLEL
jgi:hypothetical protein